MIFDLPEFHVRLWKQMIPVITKTAVGAYVNNPYSVIQTNK
jgi:hypothetical protein